MTTWNTIFADWATDRGHSVTAATFALIGTPGYTEARREYEAGASEADVRHALDAAYATVNRP